MHWPMIYALYVYRSMLTNVFVVERDDGSVVGV